MAAEIHPIVLSGPWDFGYALDVHVLKSDFVGYDENGYGHYDTTRSEIGELLYQFKYRNAHDKLNEIVDTIVESLNKYYWNTGGYWIVVPTPPTNKNRTYQPLYEISRSLARRLRIFYCESFLINDSPVESKSLLVSEKYKLQNHITKNKDLSLVYKSSILLIDDVYKTGTTLRQCTEVLRQDPNVDKIFVITMTKTKN